MKSVYIGRKVIFAVAAVGVVIASIAVGSTVPIFKEDTEPADKPIYSVECKEKKVAISFDAAWGADYTEEIMDIVESRNAKATFFMVGFWAEKFPDLVREIDRRGHEVGNHSATHPHMSKLTAEQIALEISATNDKIFKLIGKKPQVFRPPFGDYNDTLVQTVRGMNMHAIQWDVDSLDWKEQGVQPVVDRVLKRVKNGSIILFHNNAKYITQALPIVLDKLQKQGYEIVPVGDLILKTDYYVDIAGVQHGK